MGRLIDSDIETMTKIYNKVSLGVLFGVCNDVSVDLVARKVASETLDRRVQAHIGEYRPNLKVTYRNRTIENRHEGRIEVSNFSSSFSSKKHKKFN
jgi:hypothetical protein